MVFVSNAPRRAEVIVAQLERLGLPSALYGGVISSGEVGRRALLAVKELGSRCLHIGSPRDDDTPKGLGLSMVKDVARADFVLNSGPWRDGETVEDYKPLLARIFELGIPMVCLNPDVEVIRGDTRMTCAGALAKYLQSLGGRVYYYGKPYAEIYEQALQMAGDGFTFADALVVGDSLKTDIAGAAAVGSDSLLVLGGIHFTATRGEDNQLSMPKLEELLKGSPEPAAVIEKFSW